MLLTCIHVCICMRVSRVRVCMFIVYLHCHFYLIFYDRRIRFYNIMHQRYYLKFTVLEFGTLVETTRRAISSYFRSSSVGATHDFINIFFLLRGDFGDGDPIFPSICLRLSRYILYFPLAGRATEKASIPRSRLNVYTLTFIRDRSWTRVESMRCRLRI